MPQLYVKAMVHGQGDEAYVTLHTGGAVPEGADYWGAPANQFPIASGLQTGETIARKHGAQFFVQIDDDAVWDAAWGDLDD